MEQQYHFKAIQNGAATNEVIRDYFCHWGFEMQTEEKDKLFFTRKANAVTRVIQINPLRWQSQIIVLRKGTEIFVYADIDNFSGRVSQRAQRTWEQFFLDFGKILHK